jgi:putative spermidine/putrescine transport system permease protein
METPTTRVTLGAWAALVVAFLWIPLAIMAVYAFNSSNIQSWPIPGFTTKWLSQAWHDPQVRDALWLSTRAALLATAIALVLASRGRASSAAMPCPFSSSCRSRSRGSSPAWR